MGRERLLLGIGYCPCQLQLNIFSCVGADPLSSLFSAGVLTGFDASGHVAEETKNARCVMVV